jgi:hypothetical protein
VLCDTDRLAAVLETVNMKLESTGVKNPVESTTLNCIEVVPTVLVVNTHESVDPVIDATFVSVDVKVLVRNPEFAKPIPVVETLWLNPLSIGDEMILFIKLVVAYFPNLIPAIYPGKPSPALFCHPPLVTTPVVTIEVHKLEFVAEYDPINDNVLWFLTLKFRILPVNSTINCLQSEVDIAIFVFSM